MAAELVRVGKRRNQRGMTTAEYAVGTVATVSFVGVLIAIINNGEFQDALWRIIMAIIKAIIAAIGGGGV